MKLKNQAGMFDSSAIHDFCQKEVILINQGPFVVTFLQMMQTVGNKE